MSRPEGPIELEVGKEYRVDINVGPGDIFITVEDYRMQVYLLWTDISYEGLEMPETLSVAFCAQGGTSSTVDYVGMGFSSTTEVENGVVVSAKAQPGVLPAGAEIQATLLDETFSGYSAVEEALKDRVEEFALYDVKAMLGGEEIKPDTKSDPVWVKFTFPKKFWTTLNLYLVSEEGELTLVDGNVWTEGIQLVTEVPTEQIGVFVVAKNKMQETITSTVDPDQGLDGMWDNGGDWSEEFDIVEGGRHLFTFVPKTENAMLTFEVRDYVNQGCVTQNLWYNNIDGWSFDYTTEESGNDDGFAYAPRYEVRYAPEEPFAFEVGKEYRIEVDYGDDITINIYDDAIYLSVCFYYNDMEIPVPEALSVAFCAQGGTVADVVYTGKMFQESTQLDNGVWVEVDGYSHQFLVGTEIHADVLDETFAGYKAVEEALKDTVAEFVLYDVKAFYEGVEVEYDALNVLFTYPEAIAVPVSVYSVSETGELTEVPKDIWTWNGETTICCACSQRNVIVVAKNKTRETITSTVDPENGLDGNYYTGGGWSQGINISGDGEFKFTYVPETDNAALVFEVSDMVNNGYVMINLVYETQGWSWDYSWDSGADDGIDYRPLVQYPLNPHFTTILPEDMFKAGETYEVSVYKKSYGLGIAAYDSNGEKYLEAWFDYADMSVPETVTAYFCTNCCSATVDYLGKVETVSGTAELENGNAFDVTALESVLPKDIELQVSEMDETYDKYEMIAEALKDTAERFAVYDIKVLSNNEEVVPSGEAMLRFRTYRESGFFGTNWKMYRVTEEGTLELLQTQVYDFYRNGSLSPDITYVDQSLSEFGVIVVACDRLGQTITSTVDQENGLDGWYENGGGWSQDYTMEGYGTHHFTFIPEADDSLLTFDVRDFVNNGHIFFQIGYTEFGAWDYDYTIGEYDDGIAYAPKLDPIIFPMDSEDTEPFKFNAGEVYDVYVEMTESKITVTVADYYTAVYTYEGMTVPDELSAGFCAQGGTTSTVDYVDKTTETQTPDGTLDCPTFWSAHTEGYEVTTDGLEITFDSKTYDESADNWCTPVYVVFSGDEATVGGAGYEEYFVGRSDVWGWSVNPVGNVDEGWGEGYSWTDSLRASGEIATFDWASWLAANKSGVTVTIKAKLVGSSVVVTIENAGVISKATIPVDISKPVYISLTGEQCTLTNIKTATGTDIPDVPVIPDNPDVPDTPDTPDVPDTPDTPDVPDVPKTGWVQEDGKWFYYDGKGNMSIGWKRIDKSWYYFDSEGCMHTGWLQTGGDWYYMNADGKMVTGWLGLGNDWYYMDSLGVMLTGWQQIGDNWYYMESDGVMVTGWNRLGTKWYYMDSKGVMTTGLQEIGNKKYYMNSRGEMTTGWQQIGSDWYYIGSDGVIKTGWQNLGNKWYYMKSDGTVATGWQNLGNKWYYMSATGEMSTGWLNIGSKWYYMSATGEMLTGWQKIDSKWYYMDAAGKMTTGWQKIDSKWYYMDAAGKLTTGWQKIDNKWYYMMPTGEMTTGWLKEGSKWYYFDGSGVMVVGEKKIDGKLYKFDANGVWVK